MDKETDDEVENIVDDELEPLTTGIISNFKQYGNTIADETLSSFYHAAVVQVDPSHSPSPSPYPVPSPSPSCPLVFFACSKPTFLALGSPQN